MDRNGVRRPASRRREHEETQQKAEGQVDTARRDVDDDPDVENERQRRGDPKLKERPQRGDGADHDGEARPQMTPRIIDFAERLF